MAGSMASIRVTMRGTMSSPTTLLSALIEIVFGTARTPTHPHAGQFIGSGFTMAAAGRGNPRRPSLRFDYSSSHIYDEIDCNPTRKA